MYSDLKLLTLHALDYEYSRRPRAIAILIELLDLPYNMKLWQSDSTACGVEGTQFTSIINPFARVPVLEDPNTGVHIFESGAIMEYLLRRYDIEGAFSAPDATSQTGGNETEKERQEREQERADYDTWTHIAVAGLAANTTHLHFFEHLPSESSDAAKLGIERFGRLVRQGWELFEKRLEESKSGFVLSKGLSSVDLHFFPWIKVGFEVDGIEGKKFPSVRRWYERVNGMTKAEKAYERVSDGERM
jgi:glutathione S-transferase